MSTFTIPRLSSAWAVAAMRKRAIAAFIIGFRCVDMFIHACIIVLIVMNEDVLMNKLKNKKLGKKENKRKKEEHKDASWLAGATTTAALKVLHISFFYSRFFFTSRRPFYHRT